MTKRVYLSGQMTGIPEFNYPAFDEAAKRLRRVGYEVFNPAESFNGDTTLDFSDYMREDLKALLSVDEIRVLDGWQKSLGARTEVVVGLSLGLSIKTVDGFHVYPDDMPRRVIMAHLMGMENS